MNHSLLVTSSERKNNLRCSMNMKEGSYKVTTKFPWGSFQCSYDTCPSTKAFYKFLQRKISTEISLKVFTLLF